MASQVPKADDCDTNVNLANYKGIYADDDAGQKYSCPETGAHFEPRNLCMRLQKVLDKRSHQEAIERGKQQQQQKQNELAASQ